MTNFSLLGKHEIQLKGKWILSGNVLVPDSVCCRIDYLKNNILNKITVDPSGWQVLYKDPADGRYWKLFYPDSGAQGGGPPELRCVDSNKLDEWWAI